MACRSHPFDYLRQDSLFRLSSYSSRQSNLRGSSKLLHRRASTSAPTLRSLQHQTRSSPDNLWIDLARLSGHQVPAKHEHRSKDLLNHQNSDSSGFYSWVTAPNPQQGDGARASSATDALAKRSMTQGLSSSRWTRMGSSTDRLCSTVVHCQLEAFLLVHFSATLLVDRSTSAWVKLAQHLCGTSGIHRLDHIKSTLRLLL